jgi:hypothetical protein
MFTFFICIFGQVPLSRLSSGDVTPTTPSPLPPSPQSLHAFSAFGRSNTSGEGSSLKGVSISRRVTLSEEFNQQHCSGTPGVAESGAGSLRSIHELREDSAMEGEDTADPSSPSSGSDAVVSPSACEHTFPANPSKGYKRPTALTVSTVGLSSGSPPPSTSRDSPFVWTAELTLRLRLREEAERVAETALHALVARVFRGVPVYTRQLREVVQLLHMSRARVALVSILSQPTHSGRRSRRHLSSNGGTPTPPSNSSKRRGSMGDLRIAVGVSSVATSAQR